MKKDEHVTRIAKNLLENHVCSNCKHCTTSYAVNQFDPDVICRLNPNIKIEDANLKTCLRWKEIIVQIGINSYPFNTNAKPLNIKWSTSTESSLKGLLDINIEDALIDTMSKEISKEIDKKVLEEINKCCQKNKK